MATQRVTRATVAASTDKPLKLEVRSRGRKIKNLPEETFVKLSDTGKDIYDRIAAKSRLPQSRLRITKASDGKPIPNDSSETCLDLNLFEGSSVFVKDLGPQIAWRTVFIVEYFGPLLFHALIFALRDKIYDSTAPASLSQNLSFAFIMLHFLKREYETLFVHRFSNGTMPAFNIFKNSGHYWVLAGVNIAAFTYSPAAWCPTARDPSQSWILPLGCLLFVVGEIGNYSAHITLKNLRKPGTKDRGIPTGGVFSVINVTCPNYFFEVMAWVGIYIVNRSWSTVLFIVVAAAQMAIWAKKKERRYRQEFPGTYKKKRYSMLPYIV